MLIVPAVYFVGFDSMGPVIYFCMLYVLFQLLSPQFQQSLLCWWSSLPGSCDSTPTAAGWIRAGWHSSWRYEISLLVLKKIFHSFAALTREIFFNMVFPGIELDSVNQVAGVPTEKLSVLKELITSWLTWKWCNRQELKSLIRHLHPAAKVVWPGRTFHATWLTFYPAFEKEITQSVLTGNFTWTSCGGTTFSSTGMGIWLFPGLVPEADVEVKAAA